MKLEFPILTRSSIAFQRKIEEAENPAHFTFEPNPMVMPIPHPLTFLHIAILRRDIESVKLLLFKHNADAHYKGDNNGDTTTEGEGDGNYSPFLTPFELAGMLFPEATRIMSPPHFRSELEEAALQGRADVILSLHPDPSLPITAAFLAAHFAAAFGHINCLDALGVTAFCKHAATGISPIHCAAANGNVDVVRWLLAAGESPQASDEDGQTPLLWAARHGQLQVVQWLLRHGHSQVNECTSVGRTGLLGAASMGHLEVVKWLVTKGGASVCEANDFGVNPLLSAAVNNHLHIVEWLVLEGKASPTEADVSKNTALLAAAGWGNMDIVQWLLEHGSTVTEADCKGNTALLKAVLNGHFELAKWLVVEGKADVCESNSYGRTALLVGSEGGQLNVIRWLLQSAGSNVNETDTETASTALLLAAHFGHLDCVKWLLHHGGASIHEQTLRGNTPLLWSAQRGHLNVVRWLIQEGGASLHERNEWGSSALLLAAKFGRTDIVRWLLELNNVSILDRDDDHDTALQLAATSNATGTVHYLLNHGWDSVYKLSSAQQLHLGVTHLTEVWNFQKHHKFPKSFHDSCCALIYAVMYYDPTNKKHKRRKTIKSHNNNNNNNNNQSLLDHVTVYDLEDEAYSSEEVGADEMYIANNGCTVIHSSCEHCDPAIPCDCSSLCQFCNCNVNSGTTSNLSSSSPLLHHHECPTPPTAVSSSSSSCCCCPHPTKTKSPQKKMEPSSSSDCLWGCYDFNPLTPDCDEWQSRLHLSGSSNGSAGTRDSYGSTVTTTTTSTNSELQHCPSLDGPIKLPLELVYMVLQYSRSDFSAQTVVLSAN